MVLSVAVLPNGQVVSASRDSTLKVWNPDTGECLKTLRGHSGPVLSVAVLPNGQVVSGSRDSNFNSNRKSTFKVWNPDTGECLKTLRGHSGSVLSLAVLPNGQVVILDNNLQVWDLTPSSLIYEDIATLLNTLLLPKGLLSSIFSSTNTLNTLSLSGVQLGEAGFDYVLRLIQTHGTLEFLELGDTGLTSIQQQSLKNTLLDRQQQTDRLIAVDIFPDLYLGVVPPDALKKTQIMQPQLNDKADHSTSLTKVNSIDFDGLRTNIDSKTDFTLVSIMKDEKSRDDLIQEQLSHKADRQELSNKVDLVDFEALLEKKANTTDFYELNTKIQILEDKFDSALALTKRHEPSVEPVQSSLIFGLSLTGLTLLISLSLLAILIAMAWMYHKWQTRGRVQATPQIPSPPLPDPLHIVIKNEVDPDLIAHDFKFKRPAPGVYAQLSLAVYENEGGQEIIDQLPENWVIMPEGICDKRLTPPKQQAYDPIEILKEFNERSGYFGVAYGHEASKHIVIASRGTTHLIKDGNADLTGVVFAQITAHQVDAYLFARKIIELYGPKGYTFSLTGHSLGAWVSQIVLFHLLHDHQEQRYLQRTDEGASSLFAVVFDSPGVRDILEAIQSHLKSQRLIDIDTLPVTAYQAAPNAVNMCGRHVGLVYRLFPDVQSNPILSSAVPTIDYLLHSLLTHSLVGLAQQFDESGFPKESQRVLDWPLAQVKDKSFGRIRAGINEQMNTPFFNLLSSFSECLPGGATLLTCLTPLKAVDFMGLSYLPYVRPLLNFSACLFQLSSISLKEAAIFSRYAHQRSQVILDESLGEQSEYKLHYSGHYKTQAINPKVIHLSHYEPALQGYLKAAYLYRHSILREEGLDLPELWQTILLECEYSELGKQQLICLPPYLPCDAVHFDHIVREIYYHEGYQPIRQKVYEHVRKGSVSHVSFTTVQDRIDALHRDLKYLSDQNKKEVVQEEIQRYTALSETLSSSDSGHQALEVYETRHLVEYEMSSGQKPAAAEPVARMGQQVKILEEEIARLNQQKEEIVYLKQQLAFLLEIFKNRPFHMETFTHIYSPPSSQRGSAFSSPDVSEIKEVQSMLRHPNIVSENTNLLFSSVKRKNKYSLDDMKYLLYHYLSSKLPIFVTSSMEEARKWCKERLIKMSFRNEDCVLAIKLKGHWSLLVLQVVSVEEHQQDYTALYFNPSGSLSNEIQEGLKDIFNLLVFSNLCSAQHSYPKSNDYDGTWVIEAALSLVTEEVLPDPKLVDIHARHREHEHILLREKSDNIIIISEYNK